MDIYLTFIGVANLLGAALLLACLREDVADLFLRRLTYIVPHDTPYVHSAYGRVWLWWAIIGTTVFGAWNVVASGWPVEVARVIVWGDVFAYGAFEALAIAGSLSARFGPGVHVCHALWLGQGGWGLWVALA